MSLVKTGKVEDADTILDNAFGSGARMRDNTYASLRGTGKSRVSKSISTEKARIHASARSLVRQLKRTVEAFPHFDRLAPFYAELVRTIIDIDDVRNALGALSKSAELIEKIASEQTYKLESATLREIPSIRKAFYGRAAGIVHKLDPYLKLLDEARKSFKDLPNVKTGIPTIVVAGAPNVGKSTLMATLTGARPEVQSYPFTTKHLMLGYANMDGRKVQFIDTPGVLDRPKMNAVERRAAVALRHLANAVIFVIDPTLACGYTLDHQLNVLKEVKATLELTPIVVINKADSATPEELDAVPKGIHISAKNGDGIDIVIEKIKEALPSVDLGQ